MGWEGNRVVQGTSKIPFPGYVNMMRNNYVFLPALGKQTQLFHTLFTEPGKGPS